MGVLGSQKLSSWRPTVCFRTQNNLHYVHFSSSVNTHTMCNQALPSTCMYVYLVSKAIQSDKIGWSDGYVIYLSFQCSIHSTVIDTFIIDELMILFYWHFIVSLRVWLSQINCIKILHGVLQICACCAKFDDALNRAGHYWALPETLVSRQVSLASVGYIGRNSQTEEVFCQLIATYRVLG